MLSSRYKSVLLISFTFQEILVLGNKSQERAKIELQKKFCCDCSNKLLVNDAVHVWKINVGNKKFKPEDYSKGFRVFKSTETYFILAKKMKDVINLHYWLGKSISLKDKKYIAKYAIMFYHFYKEIWGRNYRINFSREYETLETESFQHSIQQLKGRTQPNSRYSNYRDNYLPLNGPNLYIIKGWITTRIKKVTFSLKWMKPNICLMIDASGDLLEEFFQATMWCGNEANAKVRRRTEEYAEEFSSSIPTFVDVITRFHFKYKNLIELLENDANNRSSDVDTSSDDELDPYEYVESRDKSVKLYKLSKVYPEGRKEVNDEPIHENIFHNHAQENFIFDSNSIAGLSFITGYLTNVQEKIWAIQYAEDYLNSQIKILGRPIVMRTMSTYSSYFHFDFIINLIHLPCSTLAIRMEI